MSAARQLTRHQESHFGTTAAPTVRQVPRAARRTRVNLKAVLGLGAAWALAMFLCISLIQKNAAIRQANIDINRMRAEISQQELVALEREGLIAASSSVSEVERWAKANGMEMAQGAVPVLPGREEAVAVRTSPSVQEVQPEVAQQSEPLWRSWISRVTGAAPQGAKGAQ